MNRTVLAMFAGLFFVLSAIQTSGVTASSISSDNESPELDNVGTLLSFKKPDKFYQNNYLEFSLGNVDTAYRVVLSGTYGYVDYKQNLSHSHYWYDHYNGYVSGEPYSITVYMDYGQYRHWTDGFFIKPEELDENFTMFLAGTSYDIFGNIIDEESYSFNIIGQPGVIPGKDLNKGVYIWPIYLIIITATWAILVPLYHRAIPRRGWKP